MIDSLCKRLESVESDFIVGADRDLFHSIGRTT